MAYGFTTRQLHDRSRPTGVRSRTVPIYLSAGFSFDEYDQASENFSQGVGYGYSRIANPTIEEVESSVASLEGGNGALLVASGQAATTTAILAAAGSGDHVVSSAHIYEGTRALLADTLARFGVTVSFVTDIHDPAAWRAAVTDRTRALFSESVSNASNRVLNTAAIAGVAHDRGIPLIVDNTLPTPYLYRPLEHGADLVVHSASKFLAGHGNVIGGVIVDGGRFDPADGALFPHLTEPGRGGFASVAERAGGDAFLTFARESLAPRLGQTLSPLSAYLIAQGLETLSLRVQRQSHNARTIARHLADHPLVRSVDYAGLDTHPDHALAQRDYPRGTGSVFSFTVRGGAPAARAVIESLALFTHMPHLGDVRSLVLHPASTSHLALSASEQAAVGVDGGTLRLSLGIEDVEDLVLDLDRALAAATAATGEDAAAPSAVLA